jgi:hypothetical protein
MRFAPGLENRQAESARFYAEPLPGETQFLKREVPVAAYRPPNEYPIEAPNRVAYGELN